MPRPTFQRLEELFNRAVDLTPAERAAFLELECAGEPELRSALEDMLRHDTTEDGRLASPVAGVASRFRHEAPTLPAAAAPSATVAPAVLPQVPGYELLEELGRGGMGVVYKARQNGLNRLVALKMLLPFAVPTAEQLARFRTEAEALARLSHPNVVPIYEIGECPAGPYFSMEYVPGPNLAAFLDGRPCDPAAAARLVEVLAGAIDAVHRCGIVHRDLKPGNVLMAPRKDAIGIDVSRGDGRPSLAAFEPKITDFGLAKDQSARQALTRSGTTLGTPCYMAPEQASGRGKVVGPAADLYSLGAILYEMLTGRPPFEGTTPIATLARLVSDDPPPPSRLRPGLPRDLITICMKCLEKSPRGRYATAKDLAEDLRRFQHGESIRARPIGPIGRTYRWCRRRPLVAALIALCIVLVVAFVVTVSVYDVLLGEALNRAEIKSEEERREIVNLDVTIGITELEKGDTYSAVLRFTEALRRDDGHSERNHRIRIGTALQQSPHLVQLLVPGKDLLCARLTEDGGQIATVGEDQAVEIWDVARGRMNVPALQHDGTVTGGAFSPDGRSLATVVAGGKALAWNLDDGTWRTLIGARGPEIRALAFHRDGRLALVRGKQSELDVCDLSEKEPMTAVVPLVTSGIETALAEDGRRLFTLAASGIGQVWDVASGKAVGVTLKTASGVTRCALSPDGLRVAVVEPGNTIRIGDVETGKWLVGPLRCRFPVYAVVFSPNGDKVLTAGSGHTALIWKVATGELLAALAPEDSEIGYARFSPDGTLLVTGDRIRGARVWNATTGRPLTPPLRHGGPLLAAAFSADGRRLVTAGKTGVVCVWTLLPDLEIDSSDSAEQPPVESVLGTGLLPLRSASGLSETQGRTVNGNVVVRAVPGGVRVHDSTTGQPIGLLMPHGSAVRFAAFSANSSILFTADADRNARAWDSVTGEPLTRTRRLPRDIIRIDGPAEKVICAGGKEFSWSLSETRESAARLSVLAQVLACGSIDEARQQQAFDADHLRSAWDTLQKMPVEK
jgi:serine/threonine protein kinase/WD40 repeat protein